MQVLIILILTVLLPNASDVPMYQALVSILIGSVAKVAIFLLQDATNFFATIVPISYFQVLQLAVFFYFAILRYLSMFIRTIPQQQKALLINQNYDAVKNLTKKVTTPEWDQEITPFAAHGDFKDVRLVFEPSTPQISPSRQTFLPQSHLVRHSENVDENLQPKTKRRILLRRPDTGSKLKSTVPSEGDEPMRFYTQRPPIQLRYTAKKILF